jgi:thiamine-monophosphate kinase
MRLRKLGERELLAVIRRNFTVPRKDILLGIGDDAAVLKPGAGRLLVTKDLLVEDYDFILSCQDPRLLGRKSLNVNISDIAAMGGRPLYALLGLGLPRETVLDWVVDFFAGLKEAARTADVVLIGGDLSQARKVLISVTVIGRAYGRVILRSGARPGDRIFVSGFLGDAKRGFLLYRKGVRLGDDPAKDFFLKAFLDPQAQTTLGRELSRLRAASAMIDCSDGLSVDLNHICEASGAGAEIDLEKIPLSPAMISFQKKPLALALHGGEDYQLIFTVKQRDLPKIASLRRRHRLTDVGRITREKGIWTVDAHGRRKVLEIKGFEHFK